MLAPRISKESFIEFLGELGIEVVSTSIHSDYIDCRSSYEDFCMIFKASISWKPYLTGGWELDKAEPLSELWRDKGAKVVLLKRDILLPYNFIARTEIK